MVIKQLCNDNLQKLLNEYREVSVMIQNKKNTLSLFKMNMNMYYLELCCVAGPSLLCAELTREHLY